MMGMIMFIIIITAIMLLHSIAGFRSPLANLLPHLLCNVIE
jgi:hypothetical protein